MGSYSYSFKWGADTYIMSANWAEASSHIMVNGRHIINNVGFFRHDPKNVARSILEECCNMEGLDFEDVKTQKMIEKALKGIK